VEIVKLLLFSRLVRYNVFSRTLRLYAAYDEKITDNMSLHLYLKNL
jgi:hypothetical protein